MYNEPVRFDGDIIITDPCYFVKKCDYTGYPSWWDFLSKTVKVDGPNGVSYKHPEPKDYEDAKEVFKSRGRDLTEEQARELVNDGLLPRVLYFEWVSETYNREMAAYKEAEKKFDEEHPNDWEICGCGDDMEALGFTTHLSDSTIYGDWSCTVFNSDTKEKIGNFCADAAQVCVMLLDEVMKYNPDYKPTDWTATIIKDFHGTVELKSDGEKVIVVGKGNVNFTTKQTGL